MTTHAVGTRAEWLAARLALLEEEKAHTRQADVLAERRQQLPWVRVDAGYEFDTDEGRVTLADLFRGRSQLLVYHFMLGPNATAGCPACSAVADGFNGFATHLANHDVMLWAVSRAPLAKIDAYKQRMGWTFPWASSFDSDFNFDFGASFTPEQQTNGEVEYNYRREAPRSSANEIERPGLSAFILEEGVVYHTYSTYARGVDGLWGMYQWLDRAPRGRNEQGMWLKRRDEYPTESLGAVSAAR